MSPAKLAVASTLAAVALTACGSTSVHPHATGPGALVGRGKVDDPRTARADHVKCLRDDHLPIQEVGQTGIQIGSPLAGPRVVFTPTPGAAQAAQIQAQAQGAEVIGSALLYPAQASDSELSQIETCLAQRVQG
jgi:hypothetical protein